MDWTFIFFLFCIVGNPLLAHDIECDDTAIDGGVVFFNEVPDEQHDDKNPLDSQITDLEVKSPSDTCMSDADSKKQKAKEKALSAETLQLKTDMQKIRGKTDYGNFGARTASANPQIDGYGFFATADFLWWKLYEGGTDYLIESKNPQAVLPVQGTIRHFNFDWEPGFKIGAGYLFEHDGWDSSVTYTYFRTHAHHSSSSHFLFPLVGDESLQLTKSKGHWDVLFQTLNLLLGRNYFVSRSLSLHPLFGLTSAWIDQHRHFHFVTESSDPLFLKSQNDFWGIGPELSLNTHFFLGKNYSVYGHISGNLLWGHFHIHEREKDKTTDTEYYHLHDNLQRMVPSIAFALGLSYETNLAEDLYHLRIKAGYENQYWFRQNQLPLFDTNANTFRHLSDDLSMQGLTIELRLDF